ncbi:glutathione S-transferase N-terminal domain-containing protein [Paraburkholderia sp. SARCC-3016]|uniref:glutathione S-transferase family protein n=1 Tax=Paraburkholderia sp. SARCC-3016 TaxID=3058611 RepID=UPI002808DC59|nr:glutathione S-transferase N-terminal domain-containing protein [Paraburkholderia sp. SARCC-3016]MDQ7975974.1 glutathione S-transferase N-terminal domain-containing protein [Paraburkholderia sp. SARCC-3016]
MQVYGRRSSINVQKVVWCLAELGVVEGRDYQRIDAGLEFGVNDTPDYLAMNPTGLVPTLVDGEHVVWESNTILRYIAATRAGGHALYPADAGERSEVERWMDWQLGTLWATLRVAFVGLTRTPEPQRDYDAIRGAFGDAARLLRVLDGHLAQRAFIALERFTLADIGVALAAHRWTMLSERFADVLGAEPAMPSVARWLTQAKGREGFSIAVPA